MLNVIFYINNATNCIRRAYCKSVQVSNVFKEMTHDTLDRHELYRRRRRKSITKNFVCFVFNRAESASFRVHGVKIKNDKNTCETKLFWCI